MKKALLKALWIGMYILCCVLGFLNTDDSFSLALMAVMGLLFFVPPVWLLVLARLEGDEPLLRLLRRVSAGALGATTVLLVANFLSVLASTETVGTLLHILLALVSVPMLCSGSWVLSLFLWACLLFASRSGRKKRAK